MTCDPYRPPMVERLVLENPGKLSNTLEGIQVSRLSTRQRYGTTVVVVDAYV